MEVIQKAGRLAEDTISHVGGILRGNRVFRVYIANGTDKPLIWTDEKAGSECIPAFTRDIAPGHAGALVFSDKGDLTGAVRLRLGEGHVVVWANTPRIGLACAALQFEGDTGGRPINLNSREQPRAYVPYGSYTAFVGDSDASSNSATAHIIIADGRDITQVAGLVEFSGRFALEGLEAPRLLCFAEWCLKHHRERLGGAAFLMEYRAVLRGFDGLDLAGRAFMVNLLIGAFVSNGGLGAACPGMAADLGPDRRLWQDLAPPALGDGKRLGSYDAYCDLAATYPSLPEYVDAGMVLLRTAAMQCGLALIDAAEDWKAKDEPQVSFSLPPRPSAAAETLLDPNCKLLVSHLSGNNLDEKSKPKVQASKKLDEQEGPSFMPIVRQSIHESATFMLRSAKVFKAFGDSSPAAARAGLREYCERAPGARRDFGFRIGIAKPRRQSRFGCCRRSRERGRSSVPASGSSETVPIHSESLGAEVFANLDGGDLTNPSQVLESLGRDSPPYRTMSTNSKSGEFFFFSSDQKFIIKTISAAEGALLFRMLPAYQHHLGGLSESLIVRYAGLHCVDVPELGRVYFTIMTNVFPELPMHETYDIKGSTYGRKAAPGQTIMKDEDWVHAGVRLQFSEEVRREMCATHERDAVFLCSNGVMDYSLLIGVHRLSSSRAQTPIDGPGATLFADDMSAVYFVGIIDFLIAYGLTKQGEHILRSCQGHSQDASAVDPLAYARRQVRFVRDNLVLAPRNDGSLGTHGTLRITIISGHGLVDADVVNVSDPYVYATLGLQRLRTPTVKNNLDPEWHCVLSLAVDEAHLDSSIELSVWDEDNHVLQGHDDFLGRLDIPMRSVVEKGAFDMCGDLQDIAHGKLSARFEFIRAPDARGPLGPRVDI